MALVIDTSDLLLVAENPVGDASLRIWMAQRDAEARKLERGGIPTAVVTPDGGAGPAILALDRRLDATRKRMGAGAAVL